MSKQVFVILDTKAKCYMDPQIYRNKADAMRACENAVNGADQRNMLAHNPEDFSLFKIGDWDELTGNVTSKEKEHVIDLIDLKKES
jgi:hypothetical protein